jgi:putative ABC transport system permease protein
VSLSLRFAARELRSGVAGFRIFLACLALGVAALAAAGSTAEAFRQGLASQARAILGGDVAVSVEGRRFTPAEQAAFAHAGAVTDTLRVRAMASGQGGGGDRRLAEVRGIDAAYPLAGAVELKGAPSLADATRACPAPRWSPICSPVCTSPSARPSSSATRRSSCARLW